MTESIRFGDWRREASAEFLKPNSKFQIGSCTRSSKAINCRREKRKERRRVVRQRSSTRVISEKTDSVEISVLETPVLETLILETPSLKYPFQQWSYLCHKICRLSTINVGTTWRKEK